MNRKVIIIGAGGHGRAISDIVLLNGDKLVGFLDDNADVKQNPLVIGKICDADLYCKDDVEFFVAIGNNAFRQRIMSNLTEAKWYTAIHPSAIISPFAYIEEGSCIMPGAVIGHSVRIGRGCIVNTCSSVDHDAIVSDYVHISSGVHIAGGVLIGANCRLAIGTVVDNALKICENVDLTAGSVVTQNIVEGGKYAGVPAKKI